MNACSDLSLDHGDWLHLTHEHFQVLDGTWRTEHRLHACAAALLQQAFTDAVMTPERLQALALTYSQNREFITNEESTKMVLVVPFIKLLGFDPGVPREVRLEYSADFTQGYGKKFSDRMDFAIF